ncbi:hypothetical protein TNCV_1496291 [Trichonephila clavipes]|nr:hypothetical protein TNCV_1496291 [Trichonephila clavipes]
MLLHKTPLYCLHRSSTSYLPGYGVRSRVRYNRKKLEDICHRCQKEAISNPNRACKFITIEARVEYKIQVLVLLTEERKNRVV